MKDKILNALRIAIKTYRKAQGEITLRDGTVIMSPRIGERINLDDNDIDKFIAYHNNSFHAEKPKLRGHIIDAFQSIDTENGQSRSVILKFEIKREDYSYNPTVNGELEFVITEMMLLVDNTYIPRG